MAWSEILISRLCATIIATSCLSTVNASDKPGLPAVLPADLETEVALSAAPPHLRNEAAIYLLGEEGYFLAREGRNGYACFVLRGPGLGPPAWDDSISGWCLDAHGMDTVGRALLERARLRREGKDGDEVRAEINAAFASGELRAPSRAGVIYMLSPINKVADHRTGELFDYLPHLMYYAPNLENDDIGVPHSEHTGDPDYVWSGLPFIPTSGPHGFIVQPLGEMESIAIYREYSDLIERVRRYVDIHPHVSY